MLIPEGSVSSGKLLVLDSSVGTESTWVTPCGVGVRVLSKRLW